MAAELDSDPDLDKVFLARARQAAERWDTRRQVREGRTRAVGEERFLEADSRARLALRVNRLIGDVRRTSRDRQAPANPTLRRLVERTTPVSAEDLSDDLVKEVVLGARNFLSIEFLERGLHAARCVGRILIKSGGSLRARGTGFFVAPGLVLTNEHVLRSGEQAAACLIEMDYEQNRFGPAIQSQTFRLEPGRFFLNDPNLDFALVAVEKRNERGSDVEAYGWLPLSAQQGKIAVTANDYLNIIQHPLGREKEVVVRDNRLLDLAVSDNESGDLGPFLHYEADTEKGSSGSPVLNDQWEVVALHHAGVPKRDANGNWLDKDGRIWNEQTQSVADISWIGNEGARVSSLIAAFGNAAVKPHEKPLLDTVLSPPAPKQQAIERREALPPVDAPDGQGETRSSVAPPANRETSDRRAPASRTAMALDVDVPVRISVSIGGPRQLGLETPAIVSSARARQELLQEALTPEDYADREGYDRRFLGVAVPMPKMKAAPRFGGALRIPRPARPNDRFELRYHRFSVIMSGARRLAYVSACNVNFNPPDSVSRDEGSQSWRLDPRLERGQQLGAAYYDGNDYDKGHLTRRDDAAWGRDKDDALAANWDTFHYTNAAPQHWLFNRSDDFTGAGLDLWGDLENHISEQGGAQRTRLSIFNGPIFGSSDKPLSDALVPLSYFKIVIWRDRNQPPGAVGFVLEQDDLIRDLPREAIDLREAIDVGRFRIRQKRIASIQAELDIDFGAVTSMDQMPQHEALTEGLDDDGVLITGVRDIVLRRPPA